tara:strand:+ start:1044 stop:1490 length:447 start_codon:yes stop_codon:yes gene_type:complete
VSEIIKYLKCSQIPWGKLSDLTADWDDEFWSFAELRSTFDSQNVVLVVSDCEKEFEGAIIGSEGLDSGEIFFVYVRNKYRRNGVSRRLVREFLRHCSKKLLDRVFLEVRVSNFGAIALYRSCGFSVLSRRIKYYADGEDAFVMQTLLK